MSEFFISKEELWLEAAITAENLLKNKIASLERTREHLSKVERKTIASMKRKLVCFIKYANAASNGYAMNAG